MSQKSDPQIQSLLARFWRSIFRDSLRPEDDRGRMRLAANSLILHLHPTKVAVPSLRFTYTFGLGGLNILLVAVMALTGVLLMFAYTPSPDEAYETVLALNTQVWFGQLIRNLHHWSGNLLMITAVLHLLRVFYTGAFREPRQFNWQLGVGLLLLVAAANVTGYLLPWDQLAYWAVTVGTNMLGYIPGGEAVRRLLLGGPEVGAATLSNFYVLHVVIIPLAIFLIASFHIWRVRKDGFTLPRHAGAPLEDRVKRVTTIPHLVSRELVFALVVLAALLLWSALVNAPLEVAANPNQPPNPTKAAWYFLGIQELLLHLHPLFGVIVIPGLALGALLALPELDRDQESVGVWFRSATGWRVAGISFLIGILGTVGFVLLDEFGLNRLAALPLLPTAVLAFFSKGLIPFIILLLAGGGYCRVLRVLGRSASERRMALFTLLTAAYVTLTIIGIYFRGAGMALVLPW